MPCQTAENKLKLLCEQKLTCKRAREGSLLFRTPHGVKWCLHTSSVFPSALLVSAIHIYFEVAADQSLCTLNEHNCCNGWAFCEVLEFQWRSKNKWGNWNVFCWNNETTQEWQQSTADYRRRTIVEKFWTLKRIASCCQCSKKFIESRKLL